MKRLLAFLLFGLAASFGSVARADDPQLNQRVLAAGVACGTVANPDASIPACSQIIAAVGQLAGTNVTARATLVLAYFDRGQAYYGRRDYDRSIADFGTAIRIVPNGAVYYNARGYAYEGKGDHNRAIADYDAAIRLLPNYAIAYQNRGQTYSIIGDYDRAIADFSNAISLVPNAFASYNARALAYEGKGDHDRAIADETQAIQLNASYGDAYYGRAEAYAAKGDTAKALADFRVAENVIPANDPRRGQASARANELSQQLAALTPGKDNSGGTGNSIDSDKSEPKAFVGKRVALIIGNSEYAAVGKLANPQRDAEAIAAALQRDGFEVTEANNLTRASFIATLNKFSDLAATADWVTIYYAGHGIQLDGVNYLVPIDAKLAVDRDVADEGIPLDRVMNAVSGARKFGLIVLDACRNNPFLAEMRITGAARGARTRGLARVQAHGTTLVEFSAQEGQEALDGDATGNSPFAAALAKRLATPGLEVNKLLRLVREDVLATTGNQQEPMFSGSTPAEDLFFRTTQ